jgi:adenylate cyclase
MEGDLRQRQNEHDAAERCFRSAIEIARRQGARWRELRASVSLAQLRQQQGKRTAARRSLEPIVSSFDEGFDTVDVRAAQGLLATLA